MKTIKKWYHYAKQKIFLIKLTSHVKWYKKFANQTWYDRPDLFFKEGFNDLGDYHLEKFVDRYAAERLKGNMYLFDRAYKVMSERGNYSRKNAFGEMHGDCYMWIEKCEHSDVIVYETQSCKYLYIKDKFLFKKGYDNLGRFHIRQLYSQWDWAYKKTELKGMTLARYKKYNFKTGGSQKENKGLYYGDCRDTGYIGTLERNIMDEIDRADFRTLAIINMMKYWELYLENPKDLE